MSDIFISYKREEQATARKLANALESEGWTVWWDPKLRAGEHFDDVIEKALNEAKCVIVMWSNLSVNSEYVKAEATEALEQRKLVPIKIESVNLPFRFKRVHTPTLLDWDGSKDLPEFRRLVEDIASIVGQPASKAKKRADEDQRNRIEEEDNYVEQEAERPLEAAARRKAMQGEPKAESPLTRVAELGHELKEIERNKLQEKVKEIEVKFTPRFADIKSASNLSGDDKVFLDLSLQQEQLQEEELMVMEESAEVDRKLENISKRGTKSRWYDNQEFLVLYREVATEELKKVQTKLDAVKARLQTLMASRSPYSS